jgi:hypothetical protein
MMKTLFLVSACLSWGVGSAQATDLIAIERYGQFLPIGTLVRFPADDPSAGEIIGHTGLEQTGAIDFLDGRLWAVASDEGYLGFYSIHPRTAVATLVSRTSILVDEDQIFGGSFDSDGIFWLTRRRNASSSDIVALDPFTGEELDRYEMGSGWTFGGLSFVGDVLYALTTYSFGVVDFDRRLVSGIIYSPGPCGGGSMGLDATADGDRFYSTCSLGSAPGPDSRLYSLDPASATVHDLGDVIPRATLDAIAVVPPPLEVAIDIKPGSDPNPVNPFSRGVIPIAILGSDTFEVADVDVTTLAFGPDGAAPAHPQGGHLGDVNDDGLTDLLSHYRTQETGIALGDTEACVTGETLDGIPFKGCDAISATVPCGGGYWVAFVLPAVVWVGRRGRRWRS